MEENLIDGIQRAPGLDPALTASAMSHSVYVQSTSRDVTLRHNIFARAFDGAMMRPGGVYEGNLVMDVTLGNHQGYMYSASSAIITDGITAQVAGNAFLKVRSNQGINVGNLRQGNLNEILNDEPIRRLRTDLLGGTPDPECARCRFRAPITPSALQAKVRAISEEREHVEMSSSDQVEALLKATLQQLNAGREAEAWSSLHRALALDPGIQQMQEEGGATIRHHLDRILSEARFPLTLSWLAAISLEIGDNEARVLLLRRYLELAPYAPDRDHVTRALAEAATVQRSAELSPATQSWLWLRSKVRFRTRLRAALNRLR